MSRLSSLSPLLATLFMLLILQPQFQKASRVEETSDSIRYLTSIRLGNTVHSCRNRCTIYKDSAISGMMGPKEAIQKFHDSLGASRLVKHWYFTLGAPLCLRYPPELVFANNEDQVALDYSYYTERVLEAPLIGALVHLPCERRSLFHEDPEAEVDVFRVGESFWTHIRNIMPTEDS